MNVLSVDGLRYTRNGDTMKSPWITIKYILFTLMVAAAISSNAQNLPVPAAIVANPHSTIDRNFLLLSGASILATVADVENTHYALVHDPHVQEANPFYFSKHPTRARMYEVNTPITALNLIWSYKWKKEDDADRAAGRPLAKYRWFVLPIILTSTHTLGVTITLASTGR
jgi:hypothetical protein